MGLRRDELACAPRVKHEGLSRLVRLGAVAVLFAGATWTFNAGRTPTLALTGFLGVVNVGIIAFLLALTLRQLLFLLFSAREQTRREAVPPAAELPPVSILVPAYNEGLVIESSIEELLRLDYPTLEIVVVDDGSTDDTFERAQRAAAGRPHVKVFRKPNSGKARTLNFALARASHPFVFCMDADSHVAPGAIKAGMRHFADPRIGAVAGAVLVLNQRNAVTRFQATEYLTGLNFYKAAQSFLGLVTIIPGPSGLFRGDVLRAVGGYEADTFAEDCDLTLRLLMEGHRVVYEPEMEVRTEVPERASALIRQRYRWTRGTLQATRKHLGALARLFVDPIPALVVLYMLVESLLLPVVNVSITALSIAYQIWSVDFSLFSLWLVQLTLLEISVVVVTMSDLRWSIGLLAFAAVNRFTYSFFLDIIKIMASIEDLLGLRMSWGKLDRVGGAAR
jgi:cellulose synthase/poly-beta-1,6-N-acetylglucosamine synthase-like glycosyltransferase